LVRDDANKAMGPAWGHKPACASHGRQISRREGHGGWESGYTKEHRESLREWRDRWEAEHAEAAAAAIEREVGPPHHPTPKVAPQPASLPSIAVVDAPPRPDPAVAAFVNAAVNAPTPGMTDAEIAAFDADLTF